MGLRNTIWKHSNAFQEKFIFYGPEVPNFIDYENLYKTTLITTSFAMSTGTKYKDFYIAVPKEKKIDSVRDSNTNMNITAAFKQTDYFIKGEPYVVYQLTNAVPYAENHRFEVNLVPGT